MTKVCDSCGAEYWGATKRDALAEGWKFHLLRGGREFVMCGDCESRYAFLRQVRGELARPQGTTADRRYA
jgi:hypothetical protein